MSATLSDSIATAFVARHPGDAARLLETLDESDIAEVVTRLDVGTGAALLESMVAHRSASVLDRLPDDRARDVLAALPARLAASLTRSLGEERRDGLLMLLPETEKASIERVLRYPEGTAGALMEPKVLAFHRTRTAGEVTEALSGATPGLRFYVYVVGDDEELIGCLSIRELGFARPDDTLDAVMRTPVESISAHAGRGAVLGHPAWSRLPVLPVVDEKQRLVGVLPYETFRQLQEASEVDPSPSALGMALALGELFWVGASGLFRGLDVESQDGN